MGGGDRTWLKDQAAGLGISDRIYFTGFVDDLTLLKLYRVSDVAVFPSLYEPFGIVALEAMAARVPVVVSDIGGLVEVVDHDVTGIVTWANNSNSLAWGILQALGKSPRQVTKMTEAAFEKAATVFSWKTIAEQTEAVYDRVMGEYRYGEMVIHHGRMDRTHTKDRYLPLAHSQELQTGHAHGRDRLLVGKDARPDQARRVAGAGRECGMPARYSRRLDGHARYPLGLRLSHRRRGRDTPA